MATRRPLLAANWKMYKTLVDAESFVARLVPLVRHVDREVVIAPPATLLVPLARLLGGTRIELAGQNCHAEREGAFTGEISPVMLRDAGAMWVVLGHSERRHLFGETSAIVGKKVRAALATGLKVILCIGETLDERDAGRTFAVLEEQLAGGLEGVKSYALADLVLAYEPVWAIGTGRTATPEIAQEAHDATRRWMSQAYGAEAEGVRILYGGSVKPENVAGLMRQRDIDGALVGGASLDPDSFLRIVEYED